MVMRYTNLGDITANIRSLTFTQNNTSCARHAQVLKHNLMKKILLILLAIVSNTLCTNAKINIIATLPDLDSLTREINNDNISITILAKPTKNPHFVNARPSFIITLQSA